MLIALFVILGLAAYLMAPEERARALHQGRVFAGRVYEVVNGGRAIQPFPIALRERTQWAVVTPAILVLNVAVFLLTLYGAAPAGAPETLVAWGGNVGFRTTAGEWHRLITAMFVHSGTVHLFATIAGIGALGFMTERMFGPVTFATVYLLSGLFASFVGLFVDPLAISYGASGAILGVYGLLVAGYVQGLFASDAITIPFAVLKRITPGVAVFLLVNLASGSLPIKAELAGFGVGLMSGIFLTFRIGNGKPGLRRIAAVSVASLVAAVASAVPLAGIDDARPEIEKVVSIEQRTATAYDIEVAKYRKGRLSAEALVKVIEQTIVPELQAATARVKTLDRVPQDQRPLVQGADAYLRLREESWRLRAKGLREIDMLMSQKPADPKKTSEEERRRHAGDLQKSSVLALKDAETKERAALDALYPVRQVLHPE